MVRVGSLFSGVGGFDLGLERAGMEVVWQVELDPFCLKVLEKHWPNVRRYADVREVHGVLAHAQITVGRSVSSELSGRGIAEIGGSSGRNGSEASEACPSCLPAVDLICGGFPCQPFSVAGKQRGKEDDRHLWPEMFRIVSELRPTWVVGENVPGLVRLGLDEVLSDLEGIGYSTQTFDIPACAVDAPHVRHRIWIVAHSERHGRGPRGAECEGQRRGVAPVGTGHADVADNDPEREPQPEGYDEEFRRRLVYRSEDVAYADRARRGEQCGAESVQPELPAAECGSRWLPEPELGRVAHGIPRRVDRLRSLGNAVVPQVVEIIGRAIMEASHAP